MINGDEEDEEDEHHEVKRMVLARVLRLEPKIALQAFVHTNSAGGYFLVCKQHPCCKSFQMHKSLSCSDLDVSQIHMRLQRFMKQFAFAFDQLCF